MPEMKTLNGYEVVDAKAREQIAQLKNSASTPKDSEGLSYNLKADDTYEVTGIGTCQDKILIIPSTYMGKPVTSIASNSFSSLSDGTHERLHIVSVTIPDSITYIGNSAFSNRRELAEVINKSSLDIEKGSHFNGAVAAYALTVHNGLSKIKLQDNYFFLSGSEPDVPQEQHANWLVGYNGFPTELYLPEAFNGESYMISHHAFYNNAKLKEVIVSDGVTSINANAFNACPNLYKVSLGKNIRSIGYQAFYGNKIASIEIPRSVTEIGSEAFKSGAAFTCIIPKTVETIEADAFSDIAEATLYCEHESKPDGWKDTWANEEATIVWGFTGNFIDTNDELVKLKNYTSKIVGDYSKGLAYGSISGQTAVIGIGTCTDTDIVIPSILPSGDKVTRIYAGAFKDCTNITSVVIPQGIKTIESSVFSGCTSLEKVEIPDSVTTIGSQAFYNCKSLIETIELPNSVTTIKTNAFYQCTRLNNIVIPSSVTSVEAQAFGRCDQLTIYCTKSKQPSEWSSDWNNSNRPVVWKFANDFVKVDGKLPDLGGAILNSVNINTTYPSSDMPLTKGWYYFKYLLNSQIISLGLHYYDGYYLYMPIVDNQGNAGALYLSSTGYTVYMNGSTVDTSAMTLKAGKVM